MNRSQFISRLKKLTESDFGTLRTHLADCRDQVDAEGAVAPRVDQLLAWIESSAGPGLSAAFDEVQSHWPTAFPGKLEVPSATFISQLIPFKKSRGCVIQITLSMAVLLISLIFWSSQTTQLMPTGDPVAIANPIKSEIVRGLKLPSQRLPDDDPKEDRESEVFDDTVRFVKSIRTHVVATIPEDWEFVLKSYTFSGDVEGEIIVAKDRRFTSIMPFTKSEGGAFNTNKGYVFPPRSQIAIRSQSTGQLHYRLAGYLRQIPLEIEKGLTQRLQIDGPVSETPEGSKGSAFKGGTTYDALTYPGKINIIVNDDKLGGVIMYEFKARIRKKRFELGVEVGTDDSDIDGAILGLFSLNRDGIVSVEETSIQYASGDEHRAGRSIWKRIKELDGISIRDKTSN